MVQEKCNEFHYGVLRFSEDKIRFQSEYFSNLAESCYIQKPSFTGFSYETFFRYTSVKYEANFVILSLLF